MYRQPVPITWDKGQGSSAPSSNESSNANTQIPFAKPVAESPSWLDWSRHPTLPQVIALKHHFMRALPIELVDIILSLANYWPHVSVSSSVPRTVKGHSTHISPPPNSRAFLDPLLRSPPLGLSPDISQPWLPPKTKHPARMLSVEVTARRGTPAQRVPQCPLFLRPSHTWLEIGVVDPSIPLPQPCSLSPSKAKREEQVSPLRPEKREGGENRELNWPCGVASLAWLKQQASRVSGCLTLKLYVNDNLEGQSAKTTAIYRFDDDKNCAHSDELGSSWDRWALTSGNLSEVRRQEFAKVMKDLDVVDRRDRAEFVRGLQVGDEVGVWPRVTNHGWINGSETGSDTVTVIEGVRVTVFWEV
ncbi:hypothetical protein HO173_008690 [Letharia columbiana]|uniref:Uncharacterized protein n=1 Tax=Letharia columbiana TaxID=112416 RepID=A0A8H6FR31_9LECA|nr:uncharacterized protein HO173_008690 [Letharia columbiana]KAF6233146.1 hypothetical protein HO173_008690 [Letharia columbiana]